MVRSTTFLIVLGLVCGGLLHLTHQWTGPKIEQNRAHERLAVLQDLLPDGNFSQVDLDTMPLGACHKWISAASQTTGYAGIIEAIYVWYPNNRFSMRIVRHRETPGFGDFITGQWLTNLDLAPISEWQSLDRVSGATITFNAIQTLVHQATKQSEDHCREK
ncbi:MAG: Na+-translocating ferredoxin:NAD+ oxidoreductase RnfG subunit [Limisphaerales bacterium]|jgi:Na+-translocating ferredoxin:NAD+ oxidoreductase RnfG subunit